METIPLYIPGLHADALSNHILVVLKTFVEGKKPGDISLEQMTILENLDQAYQKLQALTETDDDETPQQITFTCDEVLALLHAFTDDTFTAPATPDDYYQEHSFDEYFAQIYARYLEALSDGYVEMQAQNS